MHTHTHARTHAQTQTGDAPRRCCAPPNTCRHAPHNVVHHLKHTGILFTIPSRRGRRGGAHLVHQPRAGRPMHHQTLMHMLLTIPCTTKHSRTCFSQFHAPPKTHAHASQNSTHTHAPHNPQQEGQEGGRPPGPPAARRAAHAPRRTAPAPRSAAPRAGPAPWPGRTRSRPAARSRRCCCTCPACGGGRARRPHVSAACFGGRSGAHLCARAPLHGLAGLCKGGTAAPGGRAAALLLCARPACRGCWRRQAAGSRRGSCTTAR